MSGIISLMERKQINEAKKEKAETLTLKKKNHYSQFDLSELKKLFLFPGKL